MVNVSAASFVVSGTPAGCFSEGFTDHSGSPAALCNGASDSSPSTCVAMIR